MMPIDQTIVADLQALVERMARQLATADPANKLPAQAMDYLVRKGLKAKPMRRLPS